MNVHFLYQEIQIEKSKMSHHFWKKLMSHHFYREMKPGIKGVLEEPLQLRTNRGRLELESPRIRQQDIV